MKDIDSHLIVNHNSPKLLQNHPFLSCYKISVALHAHRSALVFFKHFGDTPWPKARFTSIQERTTEERQKGTELGRSTSNVS